MLRYAEKQAVFAALFILIVNLSCTAEDIELPNPDKTGGMPIMQALNERASTRAFKEDEIPQQVLANILWAANGFNRGTADMRTAPSTRNFQEIEIYACLKSGYYIYDPASNMLKQLGTDDIRAVTGMQPFVKTAPLNLVFVADTAKMGGMNEATAANYAFADAAYVSQNVYLVCASLGLGTVVRGMVDKPALEKAMNLTSDKKVILAQTVGYPAE